MSSRGLNRRCGIDMLNYADYLYTERLESGAYLYVDERDWGIYFCWESRDKRYNPSVEMFYKWDVDGLIYILKEGKKKIKNIFE